MRGPSFTDAIGLLAAAALVDGKRRKHGRRRYRPSRGEAHYVETADGTVYRVDEKGTRRRATEEQLTDFRALKEKVPDPRPCVHELKRGQRIEVCRHPEDAPIHAPTEGCEADGDRCDYPQIHHSYKPEVSA